MENADFNELVFENRNKQYGAYFLRKHYKVYVIISLIIAVACFSAIVIVPFMINQVRVYTDGTPGGIKYVQLTSDHLDFPEENVTSEPVTGMMLLAPAVTESGSSEGVLKESESNRIYYYDEPANSSDHGVLESRPSFRGGDINDFTRWVASQFIYPKEALKNKIMGVFTATFIVEREGSVSNVMLPEGYEISIANEFRRVIHSSPAWSPGILAGRPVRVQCSVTLTLTIR